MTVAPAAGPVSPVSSDAPTGAPTRPLHASLPGRSLVEHVSVLLVWLWWAFPLTHGTGGRNGGVLAVALVTTVPALLLVRLARSRIAIVLAAAVSAAAVAVCVFAPTGWYGAKDAAGYVYAAAVFAIVVGYARTPTRRTVVAVAVVLAGVEQFRAAFTPWMGSEDSTHPMVGTFYWHNPYAAYLLAPALLGICLAATARSRPARISGWVAAPLAVAGVTLSSSRASLAALTVGVVLLGVAAAASGWPTAKRFLAVVGVSVAFTFALPGPPVFASWHSPFEGAAARAESGQSLEQNGAYRTQFWREATAVARDHPVVGGGFHSLGSASVYTSPPGWAHSPLAHNGYLQAASDGGLVLALPFLGGCVLLAAATLQSVRRHRFRLTPAGAIPVAAALGTLALLAHSAVDFDWSYPANFAMTAVVAALAFAGLPGPTHRSAHRARRPIRVLPAVTLAVLAVVMAAGVRSWTAADRISHNGVARPGVSDAALLDHANGMFGSYRAAEAVLRRAVQAPTGSVDRAALRAAWRRTATPADVDPGLAALRARALVVLGDPSGAVAAVRSLLDRLGPERHAGVARDAAVTLALAGRPGEARALLGPVLVSHLGSGSDPARAWADVLAADRAGLLQEPGTRDCVIAAATALGPPPRGFPLAAGPPGGDCASRLTALRG